MSAAVDGLHAMPWLQAPLRTALASQRGHALLLHGPAGVGQLALALTLAQAWLCEDTAGRPRPCASCAACRLVQARSHPDLLVLLPEAQREALGWGAAEAGPGDAEGADDKPAKRKPSKDIRVEEVRRVVAFSQTTSARGHGKVAVVFPAERMNHISAHALLKTLEEPPGDARFILAASGLDALLPTIRSRCQAVALALPGVSEATAWLAAQAVDEPAVLLAAAGGQPEEALALARDGVTATQWLALPAQLARGDAATLTGWPMARAIDALFKVCHDAWRLAIAAPPRYFPPDVLPKAASPTALRRWHRELARVARHAEHPWHAGLLLESLAQQAGLALQQADHAAA